MQLRECTAPLLPVCKRRRLSQKFAIQSAQTNALECGRQLAALRARESSSKSPLLLDPYAADLAERATTDDLPGQGAYDLIAARFADDQALRAVSLANVTRQQDYNQIVFVGDGMCTRPFRLPWPTGTVIYLVAPGEVHERAEAALSGRQARVPRGCLLRRVDADLQGGVSFVPGLERAGYRGDRLAVWVLQGITCLHLSEEALASVLADMSNLAALESLALGELPSMRLDLAENLLASYGLRGRPIPYSAVQLEDISSSWCQQAVHSAEAALGERAERPWLFLAQQRRLSLREMGIYEEHVTAAEEAEDFFGNFS